MIIRTRTTKASANIHQRVGRQIEQSRRVAQAACDHWFVRKGTGIAAARVCTRCGAKQSF